MLLAIVCSILYVISTVYSYIDIRKELIAQKLEPSWEYLFYIFCPAFNTAYMIISIFMEITTSEIPRKILRMK